MVFCLTPGKVTGRLFFWTEPGRYAVCRALDLAVPAFPTGIDWEKYSFVVSAKTRRVVLLQLAKPRRTDLPGRTSGMLRKELRDSHPISLNSVIRAVDELLSCRLIQCVGLTKKRNLKLYALTDAGKQVAIQLLV